MACSFSARGCGVLVLQRAELLECRERKPRGVTVFNYDLMLGGVICWLEIADVFRPRVQSSLF